MPRAASATTSPRRSRALSTDGLRPQDLTLTLLGDYVHLGRAQVPVWAGGLVALLADFGFSQQAARVALSRLSRRGLLLRTRRGRHAFYALSERARRVLDEGAQRIFGLGTSEHWDHTWTLVTYSVPEVMRAERERLRARLTFLGFGSAHDGHWIAPRDRADDVAALADELGLGDHVHVFLGRPSPHERPHELIAAAWDLEHLDDRYRAFVDEFAPFVAADLDDDDAFVVRTLVMHRYRRFPSLDPDVPPELLPGPSARAEAIALFRELWHGLEQPAQRHFAARVDVPVAG
jgi:phenylacetic acid degradation operon negative regulatory protein